MFFERARELELLEREFEAIDSGHLALLRGRALSGKSSLALEFIKDKRSVYFAFSKKGEKALCEEFLEVIRRTFNIVPSRDVDDFSVAFRILLEYASKENIVIVLDNFSSDIGGTDELAKKIVNIWKEYFLCCRAFLIVAGKPDVASNFGGVDFLDIVVEAFSISELRSILTFQEHFSNELVFYYFVLTGGNPRYIDLLIYNGCFSFEEIRDFIFRKDSPFVLDTKEILLELFGREYLTYFAILEQISLGNDKRADIERVLGRNIGGYIERLSVEYNLIKKIKPFNALDSGRTQKLVIRDCSIAFWFRFIFRNHSLISSYEFGLLKDIFQENFVEYCSIYLKIFFIELLDEANKFSTIGSFWSGNVKRAIDIVAVNEEDKKLLLAYTDFYKDKLDLKTLKKRSKFLLKDFEGFDVEYNGYGIK